MADDIKKINDEINKLRAELGKNPLKPFDNDDLEKAKVLLSGLRAEIREMSSDLDYITKSFKDSVNELANQKNYLSDAKKSLNGIANIAQKITDYRRGETSLNEKQLKDLQKQAKFKFEELERIRDIGNLKGKNRDELIQSINEQELFNKSVERTIEVQKQVNKEIGLLGTGIGGVAKALSKMGFGDLSQPLTDAIEKTKNARMQIILNNDAIAEGKEKYEENAKALKELSGLGRPLNDAEKLRKKTLQDSNKELKGTEKSLVSQNQELSTQTSKYKNIGNALKGQLTKVNLIDFAIKEMYTALTSADKATGELAKSFGTSYSEATSLRNELNTVANLSGDINVNTAALQKSLIAINKEFGTASMLNGELLKDFTQLTTAAGYTEEAALGLSKITVATGTDLSENTSEILGQAMAFNATNKLALNEKEIVEGVAKASAATTLSLGMQPKEIAKAVAQSKALGTSLQQVEQIASSLLNFESSISSELEAELLTGKELNLEEARRFALNNNIAGVAREIAKQIGTAADFTKMNVIQQEALAKSVGMTREDLAKSLIEREALAKIGKGETNALEAYNRLKKEGLSDDQIAARLGDEKLAAQLKSQSVQERFNASVEKLKEIFISLAGPVLQIVSPFMDLVTKILPLINIVLTPITFILQKISEGFQSAFEISKAILAPTETFGLKLSAIKDTFKELGILGSILGGIFTIIALPIEAISKGFENISKVINSILDPTKVLKDTLKEMGPVASFIAVALGTAATAVTLGLLPGLIRSAAAAVMALGPMIATAYAAVSTAIASTLGIGAIPIIAGIAAVAGTIAALTSINDGIIDPKGGLVVSGEKGTYKLNEKDSIIAGTNLFGENKKSNTTKEKSIFDKIGDALTPTVNVDLSPLIERMMAVENVLVQILNKEGGVYLDGTKVGTAMAVSTYRVQ
jgi:uncharacterized membrane protein